MNNLLSRSMRIVIVAIGMCLLIAHRGATQDVSSDSAAELLKQANDAITSGKYADAIKDFNKAVKLRHDSCAECRFGLAVAQRRLGNIDDALDNCDKAISTATDNSLLVASRMLKANILAGMGDDPKTLKNAESEYRAALLLDKQLALLHLDLGVVLLRQSRDTDGFEELNTYLQLAPNGERAEYARKLLNNPRQADYELAPNFQVHTLQGDTVTLSQLHGKIVVLDFWATWCPPCVSSVPELKALTKKYSREQLVLLSVSADRNEDQWREFIEKKSMDWSQYWDRDGRIQKAFGVQAYPTYLVIDQDGFVEQRIVGLNPQQSVVSRLKNALQTMLPTPGPS